MLLNIQKREELHSLAQIRRKSTESISVENKLVSTYLSDGWAVEKTHKRMSRLKKSKHHGALLRDRVWSLMYRMSFDFLSGKESAQIIKEKEVQDSLLFDVLSIDDEVILAIECKSSEKYSKKIDLLEDLIRLASFREALSKDVREKYPSNHKRQIVLAVFLFNIDLSEEDRLKARDLNISIFVESDLDYYETLVSHLGQAAKYQILADMIPGKPISGLNIRVPAIKTKMGGTNCYSFSITPEYLLKISYISHRSKGKASDINTYQRMLNKNRLNKIKQYISDNGIFPTNIVVNIEADKIQFQRAKQESDDIDGGILGWLDFKPSYKSAWIIDGQHRLFSFSGHNLSSKSKLTVLAFEGLLPSKQAELFIDINAKQTKVKQSLLQELFAELHWNSDDPHELVKAISSKAIQDLGSDKGSVLYGRIQSSDGQKDELRCISLTSLFGQIEKKGFHISKERSGSIVEYGPLWAGDVNLTLKRTVYILKNWFNIVIEESAKNWWDKGSGDGGGLAMNDGVSTIIEVLRSVFDHLSSQGKGLIHMDDKELFLEVQPYGKVLGDYLGGLSEEQRKNYRDLRGVQGVTTRTRRCQQAIHEQIEAFNPPGLAEFIRLEKEQTNERAKKLIDTIEEALQQTIINKLKSEYDDWWTNGVPLAIRKSVSEKYEEDDGKRGGKEFYFDLIHYKKIITQNWALFELIFGYGKGNKDAKTNWLDFINEKRKIVAHRSSGVKITIEELEKIETYSNWLRNQLEVQIVSNEV